MCWALPRGRDFFLFFSFVFNKMKKKEKKIKGKDLFFSYGRSGCPSSCRLQEQRPPDIVPCAGVTPGLSSRIPSADFRASARPIFEGLAGRFLSTRPGRFSGTLPDDFRAPGPADFRGPCRAIFEHPAGRFSGGRQLEISRAPPGDLHNGDWEQRMSSAERVPGKDLPGGF